MYVIFIYVCMYVMYVSSYMWMTSYVVVLCNIFTLRASMHTYMHYMHTYIHTYIHTSHVAHPLYSFPFFIALWPHPSCPPLGPNFSQPIDSRTFGLQQKGLARHLCADHSIVWIRWVSTFVWCHTGMQASFPLASIGVNLLPVWTILFVDMFIWALEVSWFFCMSMHPNPIEFVFGKYIHVFVVSTIDGASL